jgi:PadR family transcriptional regulator PadR
LAGRVTLIERKQMDTTQLLKGVLDVAVLAAIQDDDGYGYDVVRRLRAAGLDEVGDASVYGTLRRLYSAGALTSYVVPSDDGPHRKYYGINAEGRAMLDAQRASWSAFATTMNGLLMAKSAKSATKQAHPATASVRAATTPAPVRTIGEH